MPKRKERTARIVKNILIVMMKLLGHSPKAKYRRPCQSITAMGESPANLSTPAIGSGSDMFRAQPWADLPSGFSGVLMRLCLGVENPQAGFAIGKAPSIGTRASRPFWSIADLVLETLANTHGNRTVSARLLG